MTDPLLAARDRIHADCDKLDVLKKQHEKELTFIGNVVSFIGQSKRLGFDIAVEEQSGVIILSFETPGPAAATPSDEGGAS